MAKLTDEEREFFSNIAIFEHKIMSAFDEEAEDGVNIPLEEGANITGILTAMQLAVYSCLKRFRAIAPDSSLIDGMEFSNRLVIQYLIENCRVEKVDKED